MKAFPLLSDSLAIITGASSGIGEAFARRLARHASGTAPIRGMPGVAEIWLVARRRDKLEALAREIAPEGGALKARAIALDLTEEGAVGALAGELRASGRSPGILVNNAGYGSYGPFDRVELDFQLGQVDLNCRAYAEVLGRLSPALAQGAVVVNVASLAAFAPLGNFAVYGASKAFALSLSVALGAEWRDRGIRVTALCPGSVSSEFARVASKGAREEVLHGWPAELCVGRALRDAARGRAISMPRLKWKLKRLAGGLAGPSLSARFTWKTQKRPSADAT